MLGLDEFSIRKGQVYDTGVFDIERKRVMGLVSGHGQKEVTSYLTVLPEAEKVRVVVMDMHEPFRQAVKLCLPQANIVVDKFHVMMHVNRALDQVRSRLQPRRGKKGELFRARFLLLTGVERLVPHRYARLMDILGRYPALRQAWALKEAFRDWYHTSTSMDAETRLVSWESSIREVGVEPFKALFPMLRNWRREILNYFDYPYTNGFVEGKNNRIKVIKRLAYGYRNNDNFRRRILLTNQKEAYQKAL